MIEFAYVNRYQVGEKVEIPVAEELLAGYNDFYAANLEFYQGQIKTKAVKDGDTLEEPEPEAKPDEAQVQDRVTADVRAFAAAWGSLDFASATLVGLEIDWDALQERLLAEQEKKVRPADSALLPTAQQLRRVASILSFSERLVTRLRGKAVNAQVLETVISGFEMLLHQLATRDIDIPELNGAENKKIAKIRTVDGLLDYANKLFALGR